MPGIPGLPRVAPVRPAETLPMLLTKHEDHTFSNQTVYLSGQAFIRCNFVACTLVLRETVYHLQDCSFDRCNWHVDCVLLWGSPDSVRELKAVVNLLEEGLRQMQEQTQGGGGTTGSGSMDPDAGGPSPFAP
jgi:hypothetical protein